MAEYIAFLIWAVVGAAFIVLGIYDFVSKKQMPFGFWANAEVFPVKDVKGYNRALGKLFIVFGVLFVLLGLPILAGQDSPWIVVSILGVLAEAIGTMAVYVTVIEKKYRMKG